MTYKFSVMNLVYRQITQIIEKNINQITFYFAEEGPGRGSEDIKKNVTSTVLIFLRFCIFDGGHGWKNHDQLKITALK